MAGGANYRSRRTPKKLATCVDTLQGKHGWLDLIVRPSENRPPSTVVNQDRLVHRPNAIRDFWADRYSVFLPHDLTACIDVLCEQATAVWRPRVLPYNDPPSLSVTNDGHFTLISLCGDDGYPPRRPDRKTSAIDALCVDIAVALICRVTEGPVPPILPGDQKSTGAVRSHPRI